MPFNKLHPSQVQLPIFYSRSGDLSFQDLSTGYNVNLSRLISGDFNLYGSLILNSGAILSSDSSNVSDLINGNKIFNGNNNIANGINNSIIAGTSNSVSGYNNVILNGNNLFFESGNAFNTCLAGYRNIFAENVTGSSNLSSNGVSSEVSTSNTLLVKFASGATISGSRIDFQTDIILPTYSEAIFSGNLNVTGSTFFNNEVYVKNNTRIQKSFNALGTSEFSSGAFFSNGNLYVNADIDFDQSFYTSGSIKNTIGAITCNNLTGVNFNNVTLTGSALSGNSESFLTGSIILTESAVVDYEFLTELQAALGMYDNLIVNNNLTANNNFSYQTINNIVITGQTGIGFDDSMYFDYIECNSNINFNSFQELDSITNSSSSKINRIVVSLVSHKSVAANSTNTTSYLQTGFNVNGIKSGDVCIAIPSVNSNLFLPQGGINEDSQNVPYIRYARCNTDDYLEVGYYFPNTGRRGGTLQYKFIVIGVE